MLKKLLQKWRAPERKGLRLKFHNAAMITTASATMYGLTGSLLLAASIVSTCLYIRSGVREKVLKGSVPEEGDILFPPDHALIKTIEDFMRAHGFTKKLHLYNSKRTRVSSDAENIHLKLREDHVQTCGEEEILALVGHELDHTRMVDEIAQRIADILYENFLHKNFLVGGFVLGVFEQSFVAPVVGLAGLSASKFMSCLAGKQEEYACDLYAAQLTSTDAAYGMLVAIHDANTPFSVGQFMCSKFYKSQFSRLKLTNTLLGDWQRKAYLFYQKHFEDIHPTLHERLRAMDDLSKAEDADFVPVPDDKGNRTYILCATHSDFIAHHHRRDAEIFIEAGSQELRGQQNITIEFSDCALGVDNLEVMMATCKDTTSFSNCFVEEIIKRRVEKLQPQNQ